MPTHQPLARTLPAPARVTYAAPGSTLRLSLSEADIAELAPAGGNIELFGLTFAPAVYA